MKPIFSFLYSAFIAATLNTSSYAVILDAGDFLSLGVNPFAQTGTYTVNTSGTTPILTRPDGSTVSGVVFDGEAVFTFDSIQIGAGITVNGLRTEASRPFALLSQSSFTLASGATINVSGAAGSSYYRGPSPQADGGDAGPGGGGGGGGAGHSNIRPSFNRPNGLGGKGMVNGASWVAGAGGGSVVAGGGGRRSNGKGQGGAFGGDGGFGDLPAGTPTAAAYGNLLSILQGGSGGAGASGGINDGQYGSGGGGGGGALELGAITHMTIAGNVLANGGGSVVGAGGPAGGGAGGGILMHSVTLALSGLVSANGGSVVGAFSYSAIGGGGGRIAFVTEPGSIENLGGSISVAGGATTWNGYVVGPDGGHILPAGPGGDGVVSMTKTTDVPEPGTGVLILLGAGVFYRRR